MKKRVLESILTQNIDGVIIEPTKSAFSNPNLNYFFHLERMGIPYVMLNAYYDELEPLCLVMDDEKGGYLQTKHLIDLGHTNIVGFFKTDDIQGKKRMKGFIKAHRDSGISIQPDHIITYYSEEKQNKPKEQLEQLLVNVDQYPTALVCYNDELALSLLDVLRKRNLKVPEEISMVGYDDSFLAEASEVKLSSIRHPKHEMGEKAAEMIVDLVERKQKQESSEKPESIIYEPKLILRNSTNRRK